MQPDPAAVEPPHVPETGFACLRPSHQRLLFFVGGCLCSATGLLVVQLGDHALWLWIAALVWVIAMRVKHGKHVRWISFLIGTTTGAAAFL